MAGLSDGTALHIHSHSLWKMVEDGAHLLLAVYKPLTADYLSGMNLRVDVARIVIDRECFLYIFRWCGKGGRHTENLSEGTFLTTVGVMVDTFGRDHYLCNVEADVGSTCHTRRDDEVGMIAVYHLHGTYGTVHLSYAALLHDDFVSSDGSCHEVFMVSVLSLAVAEQCLELRELLVHRNDNSYFHTVKMLFGTN